jgi:hypothetical protein
VSSAALRRTGPVVVQPRWLLHAGFLVALVVAIAVLVVIRRGDLDVDDDLVCAGVIGACLWLFALGAGGLVRSLHAGHALRLDAAGLHVPGLDVVPWSAVESADLRVYESGGKRFGELVVLTDRVDGLTPRGGYERWMFGPLAGVRGHRGRVPISLAMLDIEPDALLAATRTFIELGGKRATMHANVAASAGERGSAGGRRP